MPSIPAAVPVGWVVIRSQDPPRRIEARVVERANVTQGWGGWEEVARPKRKPLTLWRNWPALRMDLPLIFDRYRANVSVERELADLQRLAAPLASDRQPSRIRLNARGSFVPFQDRVWVIESLSFGDGAMNRNGVRVRQEVTLGLIEFQTDVKLAESSAANRARFLAEAKKTQEGAANKRVVAKGATGTAAAAPRVAIAELGNGQDLLRIAANELGDADRWIEIARLNGIRDPRSIELGQVIRLP